MEKKLGLCIQDVFNGEKRIFESPENPSWAHEVVDIRNVAVAKAGIAPDAPFLMLSHGSEGIFMIWGLTVSGGRQNDYIASWTLIPTQIITSFQDDLSKILEQLMEAIGFFAKGDENTDQFEKIAKTFKKNSVLENVVMPRLSAEGASGYVVRYYEESQLWKILSKDYLFQPSHSKYKGVFLVPTTAKSDKCELEEVKDKLLKMVPVKLAGDVSKDITVYDITDAKRQLEPGKVYFQHEADKLKLRYERKGFTPIDKEVIVKSDLDNIGVDNLDWKITIDKKQFIVTDEEGKQVRPFSLRLPDISGNKLVESSVFITEKQAKALIVEVQSDNMKPYKKKIDIFGMEYIHIKMEWGRETRTFLLPSDDKNYKIEIETRQGSGWKSPFWGYKVGKPVMGEKGKSQRKLEPFVNFKSPKIYIPMIVSAVVGLAIGIVFMLVIASPKDMETADNPTQTETVVKDDTPFKESTDLKAAETDGDKDAAAGNDKEKNTTASDDKGDVAKGGTLQ